MKKVLAVLLSLLTLLSCFAMSVCATDAADPETPEEPEIVKTDSGYYVGQILAPGDKITSVHEECDVLTVTYSVSSQDRDHVTSALQKKYADEDFIGVVSFRDSIASFSSGELYAGSYPVANIGDTVGEMETKNTEFHAPAEILSSLSSDEQKKLKKGITLTIDYEYEKTTLIQYTTLTGWEIVDVSESSSALTISLRAVYETREPTGFESFLEKIYSKWLAFLDKIGDGLIVFVPKVIELWARMLGKNR